MCADLTPEPEAVPSPAPPTAPPTPAVPRHGGSVVVANFNVHAGVDGWGRPFDVVAACRSIDADVLVLEECWAPGGEPDGDPHGKPGRGARQPANGAGDVPVDAGGVGTAQAVAAALGYEPHELTLATGRRAQPRPDATDRWMQSMDWRGASHAIYLDQHRPMSRAIARSPRFLEASPGRWGIAVLSRLPVVDRREVDLGRLRRDRARRGALLVRIDVGGGRTLTVVGTHMTHLSYGSPLQFTRLRRRLAPLVDDGPAVLVGDMNLWGPPVAAMMPGWRRVVRGKTWPAWRPHSQVDHILARGPVRVLGNEVLPMAGSDHRPVRAHLTLG
jgi:endonuclease/exonuclease/phosphatase family metal-dependent hydrolase